MDTEKFLFIQTDFVALAQQLPADAPGKWGKMNAQQMVEHVTAFFKISSGKLQFPIVTPADQLLKYKAFLWSDKEFRENTKAPEEVLGEEPLPLHNSSMETAIAGLQKSIDEFVEYFNTDAEKKVPHPVFGELNFAEWVQLHYKHIVHHAKQFELA
jgi:Protein of unknown function (DUF1569)